ncbi:hypothetical protein BDN72DRAFT_897117 [Pluteus cervinus]|uniref:Uncharacterized protein n=1 Tax=Pluteus cervinus TaxID=181527 RepID=A0ACD3AXC2_9AGAR|nr:hypothetical protein BDN72DRAFT_897117 [Pluteus cervinus]
MTLTPINVLRAQFGALPSNFRINESPVWNVLITLQSQSGSSSPNDGFQLAPRDDQAQPCGTDGTMLSAVGVLSLTSGEGSPCNISATPFFGPSGLICGFNFICPSKPLQPEQGSQPDNLLPDSVYGELSLPDLMVTVNFTKLGIPSNNSTYILQNSVQARLGLVNDTDLVVRSTRPIFLLPGSNLVGIAGIRAGRNFQSPALSVLGLFDTVSTFLLAEMTQIFNDPVQSGAIPRSPDIGTVRISLADIFSDIELIQEQRDSTVLKGLSAVGGLWSFLGGVFVWFFGSSILRVLRGTKPFAIFGLAHNLQPEEMRKACHSQYPNISTDTSANHGLLAILYEHLIDLDFLVGNKRTEPPPARADDIEEQNSYPLSTVTTAVPQ